MINKGYSLMFQTDYEKENPLTKKKAMIKHFNKLREMNLIDKYQYEYLIKDIQKESTMDNYYKTSKNIGKVLGSYEFQKQFVKLKKKYKFIRDVRRKQSQLNKYSINLEEEFRKRGYSQNRFSIYKTRKSVKRKGTNITNNINNNDEESNLGYNKTYDVNVLIGSRGYNKRKTSTYMRQTLYKKIKDEGIYSESEEESEDDSYETESLDLTNKKKDNVYDFDNSSNSKKSDDKKNNIVKNNQAMNTIRENEKNEDISSSVDTENREYVKNLKKKERLENGQNNNNDNIQIYSLKESLKDEI